MMRTSVKYVLFGIVLLLASQAMAASDVVNISVHDARKMLTENNGQIYLLDSRTPGEFLQMRIEGGKLLRTDLPVKQIYANLYALPKDKPYIVYCTVGSRSSQVARIMAQSGQFSTVYNMVGGIAAWSRAGFPVLQGPP